MMNVLAINLKIFVVFKIFLKFGKEIKKNVKKCCQ